MELTLPAPNLQEAGRYLGYHSGKAPTPAGQAQLAEAAARVRAAAKPKYAVRRLPLSQPAVRALLCGEDIVRHLAGCQSCALLGVTLGAGIDMLLRRTAVLDMAETVLLDAVCSALIEQAAQLAEDAVRAECRSEGLYLTGRFSPGYGDFPLAQQPALLGLINAQRAIGLSCTDTHLLVPRKSVTAVCGIADTPVTGRLAGCGHCALRDTCQFRKEGKYCGT